MAALGERTKKKKAVSFLFMYGLWIKYEQQQISTMKRKSVQKKSFSL